MNIVEGSMQRHYILDRFEYTQFVETSMAGGGHSEYSCWRSQKAKSKSCLGYLSTQLLE